MSPPPDTPDLAQLYHLNSSHFPAMLAGPGPVEEARPPARRTFPGAERVPLPGCEDPIAVPLTEALRRRRSGREFAREELPLARVGTLLQGAYGSRGLRHIADQTIHDRPVPSAGGLHPLELYVAGQAVEGLMDGVYHFDPAARELERLPAAPAREQLVSAVLGQDLVRSCHLVVIIAAEFNRTMWKYGQRGYRYVWLEAGHVGQNLCLIAAALGLATVPVGSFHDEELARLIGLPEAQRAVYLMCVGVPDPGA